MIDIYRIYRGTNPRPPNETYQRLVNRLNGMNARNGLSSNGAVRIPRPVDRLVADLSNMNALSGSPGNTKRRQQDTEVRSRVRDRVQVQMRQRRSLR